ncbi:S-layer homology domain-containing protein [Paenibacillus hexagrammi]|uniref:S-layer homology domain-containing protein n=1 Tax=Paenibacillus hexagrammi TaxID=2908839 RepID=A0ABY3SJH1_9BACL|nr:S-layer homology domain-containing protein [Paenibacillus sp. YPD9-1]UJF33384.1 S-layer homology domain-containing protein [Paenibacillus sp. YPD9-1]
MLSQEIRSKISAILVCLLFISILIPTAAIGAETTASAFKDITDSYAQKEIQSLADDQVISGYEDGSFQPEKAMTRAELAKILVLSLGLQEHVDQASGFTDVDSNSWYAGYVGSLVQSGITQGTSATTFSPDANITREELVVFFIRAMGLEKSAQTANAAAQLADYQKVSSWAQPAVSLAFQIGFINGVESNDGTLTFSPNEQAQRQALARLAYEFRTNKNSYINKAKELVHNDELAVASIESTSSTSMEVTFTAEVTEVRAEDFTFDQNLLVTKAALKAGSKTVVVLTTKDQTSGTTYHLTYKGKDTGKTVTGTSSFFGGGGGGGGVAPAPTPTPTILTDLDKINGGGTFDSLTVTSSGTVGPTDDKPKTIVTGTLTLDPGENGEILLQNVEASSIVVASGSSNSIKLKNTIIKTLRVAAPNQTNPVRIETLSGSDVSDLDVQSKVIIESTAGTLGMIKIGSAASGQEVELRGTLKGDIQIDGEGTQIKIAPPKDGGTTSVTSLNVGAKATIIAAAGTTLQHVNVSAKSEIALTGEGNITSLTVSEAAQGSTLNLSNAGGRISAIQLDGNVNLQGDADTIGSIKLTAKPGVVVEVPPSITDTLKNKAVSAIAAIGTFSQYSTEVDGKITAAEIMANNAILLGVSQEDITGYTTALAEAKQEINRLALEAAARDLQIQFADKDSNNSVTQQVGLPVSDANRGVNISWQSSKASVVSNDGLVTRPAVGSANETVVLTATLSRNNATRDAEYVITVLAQPSLQSLTVDPNTIVLHSYDEIGQLNVTANYSDGTSRSVTTEADYASSNVGVARVSNDGKITPIGPGTVTISLVYGGILKTATVTVDIAPIIQAGAADGQVDLWWNPIAANVTYEVYISTISGSYDEQPAAVVKEANYSFKGLKNDIPYFFIVKAWQDGRVFTSKEVTAVPVAEYKEKTATPTYDGNVYPNSIKLSGTAEPYAENLWGKVTLSKRDGSLVSDNYIARDGSFILLTNINVMPHVSLSVGEELLLTAQVAGKQESDPVIVVVQPTQGQALTPTVTSTVYEVNSQVSGYAEPGSYVTVTFDEGESYSTETREDGYYSVYEWGNNHHAGDRLKVTATIHGKATSTPAIVTMQESVKTDKPSVTGAVYTNSYMLSGQADLGLFHDRSIVTLRKQDGTSITQTFVNDDGSYLITINNYYYPVPLEAGEQVMLTAQAYGKTESDPIPLIVQATSGQTQKPTVTGNVYDTSYMIQGYAEPNALVSISGGVYSNTSYITASSDGSFEYYPAYFQAGTSFKITATALGKEVSEPLYVTVLAGPKTATPRVTGEVFTNGFDINGEVDWDTDAEWRNIVLTKRDGTYIDNTNANQDGTFSFHSGLYFNSSQVTLTAGEELLLTARSNGNNTSDPVVLVVKPTQGRTASVMTDVVNETLISGWAEFGAVVSIRTSDSNRTDTRTVASSTDGYFTIYPDADHVIQTGDHLSITATVIGEDTSVPIEVTVGAAKRTEAPTVTGDVYMNFLHISGSAEPGMANKWTYVYLKKQDGSYVTSWVVEQAGSFSSFNLAENLLINLTAGEELQLTAKAYGKKESEPVTLIVQATNGQTASPTVTEPATEAAFSGWAEPGSIVSFQVARNGFGEWTYASPEGSFSFSWIPAGYIQAGDQISIRATTFGKATSEPTIVTLQAAPKTAVPTVTGTVYTNGFVLQGSLGLDSGNASMTLTNKYDSIVDSFGTGSDGFFSTSKIFQPYVHLKAGDVVWLKAQAYGMTESDPVSLVVQETHGQTEVPTINDDIMETGYFKGTAEPGAIVTLSNDTTGAQQFTTASTDGSYSFYWDYKAYRVGDQLSLSATVLGKESSDTVQITLIASP